MWLAGTASATAATCNWIDEPENEAPDNWREASHWDCGVVPDGDDDIVIDGGLEVVHLDGQSLAVRSVTLTTFGRLRLPPISIT